MNAAAALGGKRLAIHSGFTRAPHGQALKTTASGATRSFFESKFKPPENASIARFDGLCCYQNRSENSDGFGAVEVRNLLFGRVSGGF